MKFCFRITSLYKPQQDIGIHRYADVVTAFMDILPRVMPERIQHLGTLIIPVRADSNNGYDLMWRIMALRVPGFDPTLHVASPVWEDYLDVFDLLPCAYLILLSSSQTRTVLQ
jgi:hypothetical protein